MTPRSEVWAAIDGERAYQKKWETAESQGQHSIEEWLMYIEDYVSEAKHFLSRNKAEDVRAQALASLRKITAMGVAAMEQHGAPQR